MFHIGVGEKLENFKGLPDGSLVEADDMGFRIYVIYRNPTSEEIQSFKAERNCEIRSKKIRNVLMITLDVDGIKMDMAFSPHLSNYITNYALPEEKQGYALNIILIDSVDGEVKSIRLAGLGHDFSVKLMEDIISLKKMPFNRKEYDLTINKIYKAYTTDQLHELCDNRYILGTKR